MKLLTKAILKEFADTGDQSKVEDPLIVAKFFNPCGAHTWDASEYWPEDKIFYTWVTGPGLFDEWGTVALEDLTTPMPPLGLPMERDLYFKPIRWSELPENKKRKEINYAKSNLR